jgi:cytosine/adenosine deaminase-related metal-dependent hydrolase
VPSACGVEGGVDWLLTGARVALDPWRAERVSLLVRDGLVKAIVPGDESPVHCDNSICHVDLKDLLILPGLVNVHDHLHFGMFPRLGHGPYASWREWANDIYHPAEEPLRGLLDVPKETRLWAGVIRNVLAGVTTVCHHDSLHPMLTGGGLPVSVLQEFGWSHSLDDAEWPTRYAQTPKDWPFITHFAEGTDAISEGDVARLEREIVIDDRVVLVHAVGVSKMDWRRMRDAGAWIVWCPTSNLHILGRTLDRDLLLNYPSIALGSDSPISAAGDLLDELQAGRQMLDLPADLLYRMVTTRAARLLRLSAGQGSIRSGGVADLFIVRDRGLSPSEALASLVRSDIAAVMHRGKIVAASEDFLSERGGMGSSELVAMESHGLQWHVDWPAQTCDSAHCAKR